MRRRVWWHILWLDLQNSIFTGLPLCFQRDDAQNHAQMVGEAQDRDIRGPIPKRDGHAIDCRLLCIDALCHRSF